MSGKCHRVPGCVNKSIRNVQRSVSRRTARATESASNSRVFQVLRPRGFWSRRVLLSATVLAIACSSGPQIPPPFVPPAPRHFSGEIARLHLDSLALVGSRSPGSPADETARSYLTEGFQAVGATVRTFVDGGRRHLVAQMPGDSDDSLLLVAAYPVLVEDEWIGDSGAALLLELARAMSFERPAYTLRFALAETGEFGVGEANGDASIDGTEESEEVREPAETFDTTETSDTTEDVTDMTPRAPGLGGPAMARRQTVAAGESLARALAIEADYERLRGVLVFDGPGRPGLRVARDLRSHPVYRDVFWSSAALLGFESTFPSDAGWASPRSLQNGFAKRTMDRVVALVDETRARPELEQTPTRDENSAASLEAVGRVSAEALGRIMHRLARIDAFASGASDAPEAGATAPSREDMTPVASGQASPQVIETSPSS
jgi:hypothetical protein